jgi:ectoine hydroxylase-related dioxygenase (phytanoyl-CoA dioxygenase family)
MTLDQGFGHAPAFRSTADLDIAELTALCDRVTDPATVPSASRIVRDVPVFPAEALRRAADSPSSARQMMTELHDCLLHGPGAFAVEGMVDPAIVDAATAVYLEIIADEKRAGIVAGDHYAAPGLNDRIWNSFQKLAERDPATFARYFANPVLDLVCRAWLGPAYRMTAQINVVHPGGTAQRPHRDYHVGFLTDAQAEQVPISMHRASVHLTLQGAISHCEMPVESGPTRLLPFSHGYELGFLAYRDAAFQQYFADHYVQLPLRTGDGVFFNHALFHAAGDNCTADVVRMANLLQVSSPFGKPMETIDTAKVVVACYPQLAALHRRHGFSAEVDVLVTMAAEGYAFPANLDVTPPVGGMAPPSQADLVREALAGGWSTERVAEALARQLADRRA